MWKSKKINETEYFLSIETWKAGCLYKFFLTDFCKLWYIELSKEQIVEQCKNINQWLEAEDDTLLSETLNLFDINRIDVQWNLSGDRLLLDSTFSGIKFSFYVDLHLADEENFSKMVISPLLLIIKNLQQQKDYLKSSLIKKDLEIAEYKLEGAVISRKNIETPIFHETQIPNMLREEHRNVPLKKPSDLVDELIMSSFNEIFSLVSTEMAVAEVPEVNEENRLTQETKAHEQNKIPKKTLSNSIIREDNKYSIPGCSVPDPIRKKPQPRKLKNL